MRKSVIIHSAIGHQYKHAQRIADHFGFKRHQIEGGTHPAHLKSHNRICFTSQVGVNEEFAKHFDIYSLSHIVAAINAAIPLTEWREGPPPAVGEWNASITYDERQRRWWNGKYWSRPFFGEQSAPVKNLMASEKSPINDGFPASFKWRGLSQEPIIINSDESNEN
jgi:hypothetical protein